MWIINWCTCCSPVLCLPGRPLVFEQSRSAYPNTKLHYTCPLRKGSLSGPVHYLAVFFLKAPSMKEIQSLMVPPHSLRCPGLPRPAQQARQAPLPRPRQCRKDDPSAHVEGVYLPMHVLSRCRPRTPRRSVTGPFNCGPRNERWEIIC